MPVKARSPIFRRPLPAAWLVVAIAFGALGAWPAAAAAPGAGPALPVVAPAPLAPAPAPDLPPFGANLFTGAFSAERDDGLSPDYRIVPGDQITIRLWGAVTVDETATVDSQGNLFIPDVGPVAVAGVRNGDLDQRIRAAVRTTYVDNVAVYTNLLGTQPVAVFVTGAVPSPWMYAGVATDSLLYYLDRAGGIDPESGSFRRVQVLRSGQALATVDLYRFLLEGHLPAIQLTDGDTILVLPRGPSVAAEGLVASAARFELLAAPIDGSALARLARPRVEASHVAVEGVRAGGPFALYVTLAELASLRLQDGDRARFERGLVDATLLVRIEGEHLGPAAMAVPIGTRLVDVLDRVAVEPRLANTEAVFLRRASIARRQKQALEETLDRLEASVLGARSQSTGAAEIRAQEAELIGRFIARARDIQPEGRLAVAAAGGGFADVRLEPGDVIVIPALTDVVLVNGEVAFPRAVVHRPGAGLAYYVEQAGGFAERAEQERLVVRRANGQIAIGSAVTVAPGDEIRVMPRIDTKSLQLAKDIVQMVYQMAVAIAIPLRLAL